MGDFDDLDQQAVTAVRVLAVDEVEAARSGHPGLPLGASPMAYVVWSRFLRFDPSEPAWPDRDRFVLSAGHGSAMLYALLHLFGYDLPLEELKHFRQWGSRTPGHPEVDLAAGIETTTGPLGQGFANAVGMALAERHMAARFNRDGFPVFDHRTYVIASDGDLMEGISHEAAALAGHLRLGRLVVLYDDNHITIEGSTSLAYSDDVALRFGGYHWQVLHVDDGNDMEAIARALEEATAAEDQPTLIRVRTHIGYGSPHKQDTAAAHGAPLGPEEAVLTRHALGWEVEEPFVIPEAIRSHFMGIQMRRRATHQVWQELWDAYQEAHPDLANELERRWRGGLPQGWEEIHADFGDGKPMATRQASGRVLNALAPHLPELIGGSADLAPSTDTLLEGEDDVGPGAYSGRNLHFGVREHAMAAICNGMALHGGLRPYGATFLIFSDYLRPSLRLAALMGLPVVFVFTHDSVGLGEDGPTHQPVEHLAALRAIPNLAVIRPGDARETEQAWQVALARRDGPTALILTRQKLPVLPPPPAGAVGRGAFVRAEAENGAPEVVLIATGSEVSLALAGRERLEEEGIATRVVSAPCLGLLAGQKESYQREVLGPRHALRVAIEAGRALGWHRWVGDGETIALSRFGASAPGDVAMRNLGFSVDAVVEHVRAALAGRHVTPLATAIPADCEGVLAGRRARLESLHTCQRLRIRDASMWGERHAREVARRLGWLDIAARIGGELAGLERLASALASDGARCLYLLGMGGSSLAPQVLREVLGNPSGRELVVVDTTDPDRVGAILDHCDPATAAVLAVSKSGATAETEALTEVFWEHLERHHGGRTGDRFVALSEHGTPLESLAHERRFRAMIPHPVDVGGRYAALSAVGIFPALWLGIDAEILLAGASRALADLAADHPAVQLGLLLGCVAPSGWGKLAWCASPRLTPFGAWAEQLVAESTGKEGKGILPVVLADPASVVAWPDTLYLSPRLAGEAVDELDAALDEVLRSGHPVVRWRLREDDIGEALAVLEMATAVTGLLLGVNPFDEPDVMRAKERARAALAEGSGEAPAALGDPATVLLDHLDGLDSRDAVALLAYLPENPDVAAALSELAGALSRRFGVPVTHAFGPRYLHSTGQLHKGGPDRIVPVILTGEPGRDIAIPGRRLTLARLRAAQATGDAQALTEVGRRVLSLHLGADPLAALRDMSAAP
jgi:transketolase